MSKKKNKSFDVRLYKEGIRQLRIPGIVSGAIFLLCGILQPLMCIVERIDGVYGYNGMDEIKLQYLQSVNGMLWICPYILPMIMTILLFRFLNQRNGSDFYHSIAPTRRCVAISFLAAIMTWVLGLLFGIGLLSSLFAEMLPALSVNWKEVLLTLMQLGTASVLAVGGIFLAMSMTGTFFTNCTVAIMILFVPSILGAVFESNITQKLPYVSTISNIMPFTYNNLINGISNLFIPHSQARPFICGIYTLVLGLIYCGLGIYVYQGRKSEAAGWSASSRWLRSAFRVIPAFVISLIPISTIYLGEVTDSTGLFVIVVLYIMAIVVYFLYELFSTGKWKNALRSLQGIWLLALLNVAVLLILNGYTVYIEHCLPGAEEIVSVRIIGDDFDYYDSYLSEIELTSEECREFVADALEKTVQGDNIDNLYGRRQTVAIETKWTTLYRYLYLNHAQKRTLGEILSKSREYQEAYLQLPSLEEWDLYDNNWIMITEADASKLCQTMQDEILEMGFSAWYNYLGETHDSWIDLNFSKKSSNDYLNIPITKKDLPKTYARYIDMISVEKDADELKQISRLLERAAEGDTEYTDIWFHVIDLENDTYMGDMAIYFAQEDEFADIQEADVEVIEATEADQEPAGSTEFEEYTDVYYSKILAEVFGREPLENGRYLLCLDGEIVADGEEPCYFENMKLFITEEEANQLMQE